MRLLNKETFLNWRGYLVAIGSVALATWLKYLAQPSIIPADVPILYLLAIVPTAIFFGFAPSILVCVLSFLAYDFFFLPPIYAFALSDISSAPILVIFLLVGVLFSYLASNLREKNQIAVKEITARGQIQAELMHYRDHLEDLVKQRTTELEKANADLKQEIIQRKRAEEEAQKLMDLAQQEKDKLSTLVNSIPDEVWFADTQKNFTLANPAALREFGYSTADGINVEALARSLEVRRPDGSPRPAEEAPPLRALKGEIIRNLEEVIRTPATGELRYRQVSAAPVKDMHGSIIGSVSVVRDITELKKMERMLIKANDELEIKVQERTHDLLQSQENYRTLFNSIDEGFCIVEMVFDAGGKPLDYRFLETNQVFERQTGLHDAAGKLMRSLVPDHEAVWFEIYGRIALTGQAERFVNEAKALNRWYDVYAFRVGAPESRKVAILFNDITERRKAEEELARAKNELEIKVLERTAELSASEEQYRTIVTTANEGIWVVDALRRTTYVNQRMAAMLGYGVEEMLAKSWRDLVDPEYHAQSDVNFEKRKRGIRDSFEIRLNRKDGGPCWVIASSTPQFDKAGNFAGTVSMFTDITRRKQAEQELQLYTHQLEAANQELESFSYSVSHDLRAPLRSMDGYSQSLLEDYGDKLDEVGKDWLKQIRASSQMMGQLIDDMLGLARVVRTELKLEDVNLSELAGSIADRLKKTEPERQIEVAILPGLMARGDLNLSRLVLTNLLDNAFKFTGGRQIARIEFGSSVKAGQSVYFIRDNGAGFDMNYVAKLFKPFQRLHSTREFQGTGIGLAIVRRAIQRQGGQVWAEGQVGKGAAFYFTMSNQEADKDGE